MSWVWILVGVALLGLVAHYARMGAVSPRIANPEVTGAPRPVPFLLDWGDKCLVLEQWGTVVMMILIIAGCARGVGSPAARSFS